MHFVDDLPQGPPAGMLGFPMIDVSRDGTQIAYIAGETLQRGQLYVRAIDDPRARRVEGVAGLIGQPRFSPDGRWLGYYDHPHIRRVPVDGGTPETIVEAGASSVLRGFHWGDDDRLVYAVSAGIYEVAATGGEPPRLLIPAGEGEYFASPQRLPGRDAVLFSSAAGVTPSDWDAGQVFVHSLASGERTRVAPDARDARYLDSGHIVYMQGTALYAVTFDLDRLEVTGTPVRMQEGMVRAEEGQADSAQYAVSDTGSFLYLESAPDAISRTVTRRSLVWVDRTGERQLIKLPPDDYSSARISPDGLRVALVRGQTSAMRPPDLWILDLETGNLRQLTGAGDAPVWSHDSATVYFRSSPSGVSNVYSIAASGGDPERIAAAPSEFSSAFPWALTADGGTLLAVVVAPDGRAIVALELRGEREFRRVLQNASLPALSPNEPWIAYVDTSGASAISISRYPEVLRQTYPVAAGNHPVFSRDGRELYFVDGDVMRAVSIEYEPIFRIRETRELFSGSYTFNVEGRAWDVHPTDGRFLVLLDAPEDSNTASPPERQRIHILVNWTEELQRQLAAE
jgi:Tol biopolymer transport system component